MRDTMKLLLIPILTLAGLAARAEDHAEHCADLQVTCYSAGAKRVDVDECEIFSMSPAQLQELGRNVVKSAAFVPRGVDAAALLDWDAEILRDVYEQLRPESLPPTDAPDLSAAAPSAEFRQLGVTIGAVEQAAAILRAQRGASAKKGAIGPAGSR